MAEQFNKENIHDLRESIISGNYGHCQAISQRYKTALPELSVVKFCALFTVDDLASALFPEDAPRLVPVKTRGDGNCLYNSASLNLIGNESLASTLRLTVAAELFLNSDFYASHPVLQTASGDQRLFTQHSDTLFSVLLGDEAGDHFDRHRDREKAIIKEAESTCQEGKWSSMMNVLALSSVLGCPLLSVYPEANEGIRPLFHFEVQPRELSSKKDVRLAIMWTRDGNLDCRAGVMFQPNHFVALLSDGDMESESSHSQTAEANYECYGSASSFNPGETSYEEGTQDEKMDDLPKDYKSPDSTSPTRSYSSESTVYDVGEIVKNNSANSLTNEQKINYIKHHFIPDRNYDSFITQTVHKGKDKKKKTLTFQHAWLIKYKWLVYSPLLKGGFCKFCVLFPPKDARISYQGNLVSKPFQNLSKATGKDGYLNYHANLKYHLDAMAEASLLLEYASKPEATLPYKISKKNKEVYEQNIEILKCIMKTALVCGRQNIALRGHRDDYTSTASNKGNFKALVDLQAECNSRLREHLASGPRNAKYTSKTVQNEAIELLAEYVKEKVIQPLRSDKSFYSIIADEVTDRYSNQEVLSVCLRFLDQNEIHKPEVREVFLEFVDLERTTGQRIADAILKSLKDHNIDISKARGQAYDGASAMSSEKIGVQALIKTHQPLALYTHCKSHLLNLSIASSCRLPHVRNMIDTLNETFLFFDLSPKRQRLLERVIETFGSDLKVTKLKGLCKTRWVERHTCYETFYDLYKFVCITLEAILDKDAYSNVYTEGDIQENWFWDRETRIKAQGMLKCLKSSEYIVAFIAAKNILETVKPLAAKLQKRNQDVFQAYRMIESVKADICEMREDIEKEFGEWFILAEKLSEELGEGIKMPRVVSRQTLRSNVDSSSAEEYYRRCIAIPFLDYIVREVNSRFDQKDSVVAVLFGLVPSNIVKEENLAQLNDKLMFWETDLDTPSSLLRELKCWKKKWLDSDDLPDDFMECLSSADEDVYPNLRQLLSLATVLPISSCEAERSFSVLRRLKTYLRSSMSQERMSNLATLCIHREIDIDLDEVCRRYIERHPRRMFRGCLLYQD